MDCCTQLLREVEMGVASLPSLSIQDKILLECLEAQEEAEAILSFLISIS